MPVGDTPGQPLRWYVCEQRCEVVLIESYRTEGRYAEWEQLAVVGCSRLWSAAWSDLERGRDGGGDRDGWSERGNGE